MDYGRFLERSVSIAPASITATTTGSAVNLANCSGDAVVQVLAGVITTADADNRFTFTVTQCATSGGTYVAADSWQYSAIDSWDLVLDATTEGSAVYAFNFTPKAGYQYIKVVATETGTASAIFGATVEFPQRHA